MMVTLTPIKRAASFPRSSRGIVKYLEKENNSLVSSSCFFDQDRDQVLPEEVIAGIDGNNYRLQKREPLYHSISLNPSQKELEHIHNDRRCLRAFTREVMKNYAEAFYREIAGRPVIPSDIKYYAKIESIRKFSNRDRKVQENKPFLEKIAHLERNLEEIQKGLASGEPKNILHELRHLREKIPHRISGKPIAPGMKKPGLQSHVHVIVSRNDASNRYRLSPATPFLPHEGKIMTKTVKKGFHRTHFYQGAESTFDRLFRYERNYVESYAARRTFIMDPRKYYAQLQGLSPGERKMAFALLGGHLHLSHLSPTSGGVSIALEQIRKGVKAGIKASEIEY